MVEYVAHRHSKELKQRQRRRQQEREKNAAQYSCRFNKQNNNFARASCFFVHFFTVAARLQRKKCRISTLTANWICSQL